MKNTHQFWIILLLIWMGNTSNISAAIFYTQQIKISSDTLEPDLDDVIFVNPLEFPRFPGCEDLDISQNEKKKCAEEKMNEFIYANLKIPEIAQQIRIEGMAVVSFIVDKEGNIVEPKILRDIGGGFGEECLRVVASMPQWIPGKQYGEPVRVQLNLPIRFSGI